MNSVVVVVGTLMYNNFNLCAWLFFFTHQHTHKYIFFCFVTHIHKKTQLINEGLDMFVSIYRMNITVQQEN